MSKQKERNGLTIHQKLLLKKYCSDQKSIREMADQIGANYQVTYNFIVHNNLPAKMIESAHVRKNAMHQTRSNVFHVSSRSNWLV